MLMILGICAAVVVALAVAVALNLAFGEYGPERKL